MANNYYSDKTKKKEQELTGLENSKPSSYNGQYGNKVNNLMDQIVNKKSFSYDFNADPLYQQYKDNYTKLGKEASMNAVANASSLTGGYGNSYATTAGAQANQQYLSQLNNVIPELYNAALDKYRMESEDLYNQYAAAGEMYDREYGQYRDAVSDYQNDREFLYGQYQDSVANDQWNKEFEEAMRQYNQNFAYQQERDKTSDDQWAKEFAHQVARDEVADSQWNKEFEEAMRQYNQNFAYQQERDKTSDDQWAQEFAHQVTRDEVADSQWNKEFEEAMRQYNQNFAYQQDRDKVADSQWQKEFDTSNAQWNKEFQEAVRQYNQDYAYQQSRDKASDDQWAQEFARQLARDEASDSQWQQEFSYKKSQDAKELAQKTADKTNSSSDSRTSNSGSGKLPETIRQEAQRLMTSGGDAYSYLAGEVSKGNIPEEMALILLEQMEKR